MGINKRHISMKEGSVYLNGVKILEAVKCQITSTPDVWEGKTLGDQTKDRRWVGMDHKVSITEYKSTPWLKEALKEYTSTGATPEFTIQGVQSDSNSDYFDSYGGETITATGCVITSSITLTDLDTAGEMVQNTVEFGAKKVA